MRMTFATYNIHRCTGWDGRYDPERIAGVLKELDADVIALQELNSPDHHGLELLNWFSEQTKLRAIAGPTLLHHTGHYGNAVLTRCTEQEIRRVDISQPGREPRGAIDLDLECDHTGTFKSLRRTWGSNPPSVARRSNSCWSASARNIVF